MINEAKFELLRQIEKWAEDLKKYGKQHQRETELFYLERLSLINSTPATMEEVIRKYEQLKYVHKEITKNHAEDYMDDTFNTLYNKYCTEKKQKQKKNNKNQSSQQDSKSQSKLSVQKQISPQNKQSIQSVDQQDQTQTNQIMNEYIDEIEYYGDKIGNSSRLIENHTHQDLKQQLQQLLLEQTQLKQEFQNIQEENQRVKDEIVTNQQRVFELRDLQLQLIDEFKQFN